MTTSFKLLVLEKYHIMHKLCSVFFKFLKRIGKGTKYLAKKKKEKYFSCFKDFEIVTHDQLSWKAISPMRYCKLPLKLIKLCKRG